MHTYGHFPPRNSGQISCSSQKPALHHFQAWQWEAPQRIMKHLVCPVLELCLTGIISQSHILICFLGITENGYMHLTSMCEFPRVNIPRIKTLEKTFKTGKKMKIYARDKNWEEKIVVNEFVPSLYTRTFEKNEMCY